MTTDIETRAREHEAKAAAHEAEAAASWERSDTDGFLSQWASGISANKERLAADIIRNGGYDTFPALFRDGTLVPAVIIETRYGSRWGVFNTAREANMYNGNIIEWVPLGREQKKGYTRGLVRRLAEAYVAGRGRGLSGSAWAAVRPKDGMRFNPDAEVVTPDTGGRDDS